MIGRAGSSRFEADAEDSPILSQDEWVVRYRMYAFYRAQVLAMFGVFTLVAVGFFNRPDPQAQRRPGFANI